METHCLAALPLRMTGFARDESPFFSPDKAANASEWGGPFMTNILHSAMPSMPFVRKSIGILSDLCATLFSPNQILPMLRFLTAPIIHSLPFSLWKSPSSASCNPGVCDQMPCSVTPLGKLPRYTPLVGLSLMVFFALACQCMSTLATVRRETRSWGWTVFLFAYTGVLAWLASFAVYQGGRLLGFE